MALTIDKNLAFEATAIAVSTVLEDLVEHDPDDGDHVVPGELRRFLARLRLLHGVPFSYLVPDAELLPLESIRFFHVDRRWTDALVQGALSVGTTTTADRAQLESVYPYVRDDVDLAERTIREPHGEERLDGPGGTITGFLLRSRRVSGWPGLHIRAYRRDVIEDDELTTEAESHPDRMKLLRVERLAPAVLLVLVDGVPAVIHIEEPRQGIQFGARLDPEDPPESRRAKVRAPERRHRGSDPAGGRLHARKLDRRSLPRGRARRHRRRAAPPADGRHEPADPRLGPTVEPHEYALQMLRFPYRQVFGDPDELEGSAFYDLDAFVVTTSFATLGRPAHRAFGDAPGRRRDVVSEPDFESDTLSEILRSQRFLALDRAAVEPSAIATWDDSLLRDMRLLVPIDVQALVVPKDGKEPMVRLPMLLAGEGADPDDGHAAPFAPGARRSPGVHLHWAMPDALLRGRLEEREAGSANRLGLRPLPDRWVVLRILYPIGAKEPTVRGWVLEADRAVAVPLEKWSEGSAASRDAKPAGVAVRPEELTGTVGGSVVWAGVYDAVLNRFAFHDPLAPDELADAAPKGVDGDSATYVVAGWWRDPAADPLDAARSSASLGELLETLRWRQLTDWAEARSSAARALERGGAPPFGRARDGQPFRPGTRSSIAARVPAPRAAASPSRGFLRSTRPSAEAIDRRRDLEVRRRRPTSATRPEPWHLRSTLLHGVVYGVPLTSAGASGPTSRANRASRLDRTPRRRFGRRARVAAGNVRRCASGHRAAPGRVHGAEAEPHRLARRRGRDRRAPRTAAAFASLPGGTAGTDRFVIGGREGTQVGRDARRSTVIEKGVRRRRSTSRRRPRASSSPRRSSYDLVTATESKVHALTQTPESTSQPPRSLASSRGRHRASASRSTRSSPCRVPVGASDTAATAAPRRTAS